MAKDEPLYIFLSNTYGPSSREVDPYGSAQGATIARSEFVLSEANDRSETFRHQHDHPVLVYNIDPVTAVLPPVAQFDPVDREPHVRSCSQISEEQKSRHLMLSTYRKLHTLYCSNFSISRFRSGPEYLEDLLSPRLRICFLSRDVLRICRFLRRNSRDRNRSAYDVLAWPLLRNLVNTRHVRCLSN